MKILEEIIISDALGLDELESKINYARGETIHCCSYYIQSIKMYQRIDFGIKFLNSIMNFFNLNYKEFGIKENQCLPNWLTYKLNNNGVIHLFGTPNE